MGNKQYWLESKGSEIVIIQTKSTRRVLSLRDINE